MTRFSLSAFLLLFCWSETLAQMPKQLIEQGVLDLRSWDFEKQGNIELHGDWEFYWKQLYTSKDFSTNTIQPKVFYYAPQRMWNNVEVADTAIGYAGYATLRAIILLPSRAKNTDFGIRWKSVTTSVAIFCDGKGVGGAGKVGRNEAEAIPRFDPNYAFFTPKSDTLEIVVHISNYHHRKGGIWHAFSIGKVAEIKEAQQRSLLKEVFLAGCMLIMAIYHLGFYRLRTEDKSTFYFSMTCFFLFLRIFTTGETQFTEFISTDWNLLTRAYYLALINVCYFFMRFMTSLFDEKAFPVITKMSKWFTFAFSIYVLFIPIYFVTYSLYVFYALIIFAAINAFKATIHALKSKKDGASTFVLATALLTFTAIHDIVIDATKLKGEHWIYWGILSFILIQAYVLSLRFAGAFKKTEILGKKLKFLNKSLEEKVEERTMELETTNESLLEFNEVLASTNTKMTASINYAKRIQRALLVGWKQVKNSFGNSFVLFQPKDIVSGDFYWFTQHGNKSIFAMLDCTGHGVPGAFMSIIGNELLNKITNETPPREWDAAKILNRMDEGVRKNLNHEKSNMQDGMDMALCIVDSETQTMQFAGAKVPVFYFQNGESFLVKGCKKPVGGDAYKTLHYESHTIDVSKPTFFYLYSDGYQDQFGGKEGRKFMSLKFRQLLTEIHHEPATTQKKILVEEMKNWKGKNSQVDDILVMGVEVDLADK